MEKEKNPAAERIRQRLCDHRLPRWEELPDFELYMDQVLALISRYLGETQERGEKLLTASMVNNYVKLAVMPAPVKKKYSRTHIAHLLVICALKQVLSISDLRDMLRKEGAGCDEAFYNSFRDLYEEMNSSVADAAEKVLAGGGEEPLKRTLLYAALRAQAEQTAAQEALAILIADNGAQ